MRAEPHQLLHMHETVLEDGLGDVRSSFCPRHQRHQLGLQIGRKAREWRGRHLDRGEARAVALDAHAGIGRGDLDTRAHEHVERRLQQFAARIFQKHVAAGHRGGHGIGAGLDAVGQHAVASAIKLRYALDHDARGARAGDFGAHLVEAIGDVLDLRFARGVLDDGGAARQRGRHQCGMGPADRHLGKFDLAVLEAALGAGDDIAPIDLDFGAQAVERHDQKIDRARADGAAARHRYFGFAHARDQRRHHPEARAHARHQLIGSRGVDDVGGGDVERLTVVLGFARTLAAHHDIDAVIAEDALEQIHVGKPRHVVENERLVGEQARDHQRQGGVLGAGDRNRSVEPLAPVDANAIHAPSPRFPQNAVSPPRRHHAQKLGIGRGSRAGSSALVYARQFRRNRGTWRRVPRLSCRRGLSPGPCAA